jgi:hypothetical protein
MAATVVVDRRSGKIRRHEFIGNDAALAIDKAAQMATPPFEGDPPKQATAVRSLCGDSHSRCHLGFPKRGAGRSSQ